MSTTPTHFAAAASSSSISAAPGYSATDTVMAPEVIATSTELTPEELWALFELELKFTDPGHQPC